MIRVRQCCCGCTLDVGARILVWADLIASSIVGLNVISKAAFGRNNNDALWALTAFIIGIKLIILVSAVLGINRKKPSYIQPYIVYNVVALIAMAVLIFIAIFKFQWVLNSNFMEYLVLPEENHTLHHSDEIHRDADVDHYLKIVSLYIMITFGIINFFMWIYFTIVLYSYYETLFETSNFTSIDVDGYFAPPQQMVVPKATLNGTSMQESARPQMFYPPSALAQQGVILYPQAPPCYDEVVHQNEHCHPSVPLAKQ